MSPFDNACSPACCPSDAVLLPSGHSAERGVPAVVRGVPEHPRTGAAPHGRPTGR